MKAEEKLLIFFTTVSLAAARTWEAVCAQNSNDGIKD